MNVTFAPRLRLGQYELLVELASGGMATVAVARQHGAAGFERLVVVKRVHRHLLKNTDFTNMFRDEARLASSIRHPNVVSVIDVVEAGGELMLVMEYFESQALSTMLETAAGRGELLPPPVVSRIVSDLLAGLHAAHEAVDIRRNKLGIVHRDVSPQNVIVDVDGVSRVIDFGIAKAASRLTRTRSGFVKGKLGYMSPEQVEAQPIDRRTDIFAAGVVLHEALTARRLFDAEDEFETMRRVLRGEVPDVSKVTLGVPQALDPVLRKALAVRADDRYATALELQAALEAAVPPAHPREVAASLLELCAAPLEERHAKLQAVLGEELEKLSPRGPDKRAGGTLAPALAGGALIDAAKTLRDVPPEVAQVALSQEWAPTLKSGEPSPVPPFVEETGARISSAHDVGVAGVPSRASTVRMVGLLLVAAIAVGGIALASWHRGAASAEAVVSSAPSGPIASTAAPPTTPNPSSAVASSTPASIPFPPATPALTAPRPPPLAPSPVSTQTSRTPRPRPTGSPRSTPTSAPAGDQLQSNPYGPAH